jgi:hypothetical protein
MFGEPLQQLDLVQRLIEKVLIVLDHLLPTATQRWSKRLAAWHVVQVRILLWECLCCNIATANKVAALLIIHVLGASRSCVAQPLAYATVT